MATGMLYQLRCCVLIVLFAIAKIRGFPNPTAKLRQVAASSDRIDGSQESLEQDLATETAEEDFVDSTTQGTGTTHDRGLFTDTPIMDVVTIIWYLATFIALISFFLVMACADRNRCRSRKPATEVLTPPPTPAPSYRQFAPPSYDTLVFEKDNDSIFIIPYDGRIESEHQQYAESLADNLEHIIALPPSPPPLPDSAATSSDISSNSDVPVASEVSIVVPVPTT